MNELPKEWVQVTISDIANLVRGVSYKRDQVQKEPFENSVPLLRATNIDGTLNLSEDLVHVPPSVVSDDQRLRLGDIVVASSSGSSSVVGKSAQLRTVWKGTFGAFCTVVRPNQLVSTKYLAHWLAAPPIRRRWSDLASGTNINNLKRDHFLSAPVPLAPRAEQDQIVAVIEEQFSRLDAAEASLRRAQRNVERMRRAVLAGVGNPTNAEWTDVGSVAEVQGGIQKQPKRRPVRNKFPFLRVANVGRGRLDLGEVHEVELFDNEIDRFRLQDGDLLVVEGNGSPDQIGRCSLWHNEIKDCVHQNHLIRVRPGPKLVPGFLNFYWNAPQTSSILSRIASSTSGLYTLSTAKIRSIPVPLIPIVDQCEIVTRVDQQLSLLDSLATAIDHSLTRSTRLRRSILEQAFSGKLVPQDPDDEPASALLERLQAERAVAPPAPRRPRKRALSTKESA